MSFDDGYPGDMTSSDDFRAKIAAAMQEAGIGMTELCRRAGVEETVAIEAISRGTYGLPATLVTLSRLLRVLGLDPSYLFGQSDVAETVNTTEKRRALRTLVWDFMLRREVPRERRRRFAEYCIGLLRARPNHTMKIAARPSVPRTVLDVAFIYDRLVSEGYFAEERSE